jgi:CRISPR-associated protein Cas2
MGVPLIRSVYVCYDVADPRRLRRVAKVAEEAGLRVQKSVFECSLNTDELRALRHRLASVTVPDEDRLLYQPLCPQCQAQIQWHGKQPAPEHSAYWVV